MKTKRYEIQMSLKFGALEIICFDRKVLLKVITKFGIELIHFASTIVEQFFWIQIKFTTEDSNAIHTTVTTRQLKLNEVIN